MKLKVIRDTFSDETTIGKLYINGEFECYTLEDKDRYLEAGGLKIPKITAIPRGVYKIEFRFSPHFNCITPHLIDVNGFEYVLIHWGNYAKDTDGCILVGLSTDTNFIGQSKQEFAQLMSKLKVAFNNGEDVEIEIC